MYISTDNLENTIKCCKGHLISVKMVIFLHMIEGMKNKELKKFDIACNIGTKNVD